MKNGVFDADKIILPSTMKNIQKFYLLIETNNKIGPGKPEKGIYKNNVSFAAQGRHDIQHNGTQLKGLICDSQHK
jgi:hypothetical protein